MVSSLNVMALLIVVMREILAMKEQLSTALTSRRWDRKLTMMEPMKMASTLL